MSEATTPVITSKLFPLFLKKHPDAVLEVRSCDNYYKATVDFNFRDGYGPANYGGGHGDTPEDACDYALLMAFPSLWACTNLPRIYNYDQKYSLNEQITLELVMTKYKKPKYDTDREYTQCCLRMVYTLELLRIMLKSNGLTDGDKINKNPEKPVCYHKIADLNIEKYLIQILPLLDEQDQLYVFGAINTMIEWNNMIRGDGITDISQVLHFYIEKHPERLINQFKIQTVDLYPHPYKYDEITEQWMYQSP